MATGALRLNETAALCCGRDGVTDSQHGSPVLPNYRNAKAQKFLLDAVLRSVVMLDELLKHWEPYRNLPAPPAKAIQLWVKDSRIIYIDDRSGPAVPYPAIDRHDGSRNHGYVRLKENFRTIGKVPEVQGWPELQKFLETVNAPDSPIERLGCEKCYFPLEGRGAAKVSLGSYVDVAFSDTTVTEKPENFLRLAVPLVNAVEGCERSWGQVELGLQPLRYFFGSTTAWNLLIRVTNQGRTEEEARRFWGESIRRMGDAIAKLPANFPCR